MCESKGQGARSGCVISGLGSSSASMVLRECGQPDGGEREEGLDRPGCRSR